jgi:protein TonB
LGGAEPDAAAAGWREHRPALRRRLPADLSSPERRAGREGHVVRVLIGVDGRVKQVERVSATSGAFFAATRAQAFAKWRFTPATRGDAPVEQWKQMRVSLVPENE